MVNAAYIDGRVAMCRALSLQLDEVGAARSCWHAELGADLLQLADLTAITQKKSTDEGLGVSAVTHVGRQGKGTIFGRK